MKVMINSAYRWHQEPDGMAKIYYASHGRDLAKKVLVLKDVKDIQAILADSNDFSSGIVEEEDRIVAWVDHIRSHPLYYSFDNGALFLSNDARSVLKECVQPIQDEGAVVDFTLAGFIGGADTLYKNIKCLEPGSVLVFHRNDNTLSVLRYFKYLPEPKDISFEKNLRLLGNILDDITIKIINRAHGRPIWIPLSAGLDSRIILCKLHEHGYKNLRTFTYGPRFNFEAVHAGNIARKLNVSWQFVYTSRSFCQELFLSDERRTFTRFSDGLKTVPCMREFSAIKKLKDKKNLPEDAIIINGQSGDYISGGHVDDFWFRENKANEGDLMRIVTAKHYDLWSGLKTKETMNIVHDRIRCFVPGGQHASDPMHFAAFGETWEYDARQIMYVVNGQRSYEFFGYDWELPLWEKSLVDFFAKVPYAQKRGQALFKAYLKHYNYGGLFPQKEPHIWRWPVFMLWVLPVGKVLELVFSKKKKQDFYAFMRYFGHYSNQYSYFPFSLHIKTAKEARNVVSLFGRQWFVDNPQYALPARIREAMRIGNKGPFKL